MAVRVQLFLLCVPCGGTVSVWRWPWGASPGSVGDDGAVCRSASTAQTWPATGQPRAFRSGDQMVAVG